LSGSVTSTLASIESHLNEIGASLDSMNQSLDRIDARLQLLPTTRQLAVIYSVFVFATVAAVLAAEYYFSA
jgi:hypothetical protein